MTRETPYSDALPLWLTAAMALGAMYLIFIWVPMENNVAMDCLRAGRRHRRLP